MSDLNIYLSDIDVAALAEATHKPGAVRLDGFPLLAYSPTQHGPGIHLEDGKASVHDVAVKAAELPDRDALAAHFGTSVEHIHQALAYAAAVAPKG